MFDGGLELTDLEGEIVGSADLVAERFAAEEGGAMRLLELAFVGVFRRMFVVGKVVAADEEVERFLQLAREVVFHLRVAAARLIGGALLRLGAVDLAGEVDHGVARGDLRAQHVAHCPVVRRKISLLDRHTA